MPKRRALTIFGALVVLVLPGVAVAGYVLSLPQFGGKLEGEELEQAHHNAHYHDGKFANVVPQAGYRWAEIWQMFNAQMFGKEVRVPPSAIPVIAVTPDALKTIPPASELRAFWMGYASVFI